MILVMKDGDIVEQGRHEELLKKQGFYANLYNSQFRGEPWRKRRHAPKAYCRTARMGIRDILKNRYRKVPDRTDGGNSDRKIRYF